MDKPFLNLKKKDKDKISLLDKKSQKNDVNEMIKPNIINGLDLTFSFFLGGLFEDKFLSFFL